MTTSTPRRGSGPAKPRSSVDRSPVALDLDSLERENAPEPFVVKLGGRRISMIDVRDLDWQLAASLSPNRPYQFFEAVVPEDEQEHFLSQQLPLWKIERMAQQYRDHYGLGDEGNSRG